MLANSGFKLLQSFAVSVLCRNILSCLLAFIWLSLYTAAIKVLVRSTALHASIILVKIVWSWSILSRTLNDDSSLNAPPVLSGKKLDVCDASIVASIHSTPLWTSFLIDVTVLTIVACSWAFFIAKSFQVFFYQRSAFCESIPRVAWCVWNDIARLVVFVRNLYVIADFEVY